MNRVFVTSIENLLTNGVSNVEEAFFSGRQCRQMTGRTVVSASLKTTSAVHTTAYSTR